MVAYLFMGERRSPTAVRMGVTWVDGRLCAKNLHGALLASGIEPSEQLFGNVYEDDGRLNPADLERARVHALQGGVVVALGKRAAGELTRSEIPHLCLVHPAARGRIRKQERYHAHVAQILGGHLAP